MEKMAQNYRLKSQHSVIFEQKKVSEGERSGAAAPRVAFLRKKLRKNLLQRGAALPPRFTSMHFDRLPPNSRSGAIRVIFGGMLFAREKHTPRSDRNTGQKKARFLLPRISIGLAEKPKLLRQK